MRLLHRATAPGEGPAGACGGDAERCGTPLPLPRGAPLKGPPLSSSVTERSVCACRDTDREEILKEIQRLIAPRNQLEGVLQMQSTWLDVSVPFSPGPGRVAPSGHAGVPSTSADTRTLSAGSESISECARSSALESLGGHLVSLGHTVRVRRCEPAEASDFLRHLRHTSLIVCPSERLEDALEVAPSTEVVVDPSFRDQFRIPFECPLYEDILGHVPDTFVGSFDALGALVHLLTQLMATVMQKRGVPLPPWRKAQSLITKWLRQPGSDMPWEGGVARRSQSQRWGADLEVSSGVSSVSQATWHY